MKSESVTMNRFGRAAKEIYVITPAIKYKAVIPRLDRGIHKELDAPIKSEHDIFHLYSCRYNNALAAARNKRKAGLKQPCLSCYIHT